MKPEELKKINRIIVHGNCPDGMASAILLYDALKIEPEFHLHSTNEFQNLKITPRTLFCDICPPEHLVDKFVEAEGVVLDHHRAAEPSVRKFGKRGVFGDEDTDPGISGASLAYKEVWEPIVGTTSMVGTDFFAHLAGVRDTWQKQDSHWELACHQAAGLTFYPWKHFKDKVDSSLWDRNYEYQFRDEMMTGKLIFENRITKAGKCAKEAYIEQVGPHKVAIFNDSDHLTSDVADILRKEGCNIIAGFHYSKYKEDSRYPLLCLSIRSDGSADVSELAKQHGGGGHTRAAGYGKTHRLGDDPFSLFLIDVARFVDGS